MTENGFQPDDETFVPDAAVESAALSSEWEPTNVCRVTALAALLDRSGLPGARLSRELQELGFSQQASEPTALFGSRPFSPYDWLIDSGFPSSSSESRVSWWTAVNESADTTTAGRFLVAVLGSPLERESAAAAATLVNLLPRSAPELFSLGGRRLYEPYRYELLELLDEFSRVQRSWFDDLSDSDVAADDQQREAGWNGDAWADIFDLGSLPFRDRDSQMYILRVLVNARLGFASRSSDPVTRSFAFAAQLGSRPDSFRPATHEEGPVTPAGALVLSTMIHGTFGWKGDWWRPTGGFHQHILKNHRTNLYSRGARFSWSGAYSARQRQIAASDFVDWAYELAPHGFQTIFAHSYGGDIAAQAALSGVSANELALLSCPGTDLVDQAIDLDVRIADIRLPFDPVLAIARTPQRLRPAPNITEVLLDWSLDHSASHKEAVWVAQSVAERAGM